MNEYTRIYERGQRAGLREGLLLAQQVLLAASDNMKDFESKLAMLAAMNVINQEYDKIRKQDEETTNNQAAIPAV